ncbi:MAG: ATP-binding protein [Candidatus Omnitrophota bacterium]
MMIKRYLENKIFEDLKAKMVFISGPRQVGKTTLAKLLGNNYFDKKYEYLNWDARQDRRKILDLAFEADKRLLIFDEIHKYKVWKNYLKGQYDKYKEKCNIIVTGSARLDIFRKGGDSLLGRYHLYRLHPFSLAEVMDYNSSFVPFHELNFTNNTNKQSEIFNNLFKFGGFPEVFLSKNEKELRRWHNERVDRLIKEDIRDIENLRDLSALEVLVELLPSKVGSLFSLNSLREDLNTTHKTLSHWVDILEKFYYHFRIYPFNSNLIKSLRKEPKLYLWDWSEIKDDDIKLENIVASHLLKFCNFIFDAEGYRLELYYLRDKEQREVDFLVTVDGKPWFSAEVKNSSKEISSHLKYFNEKLKIPFSYQIIKEEGIDILKDNIRVIDASKFLSGLI